MEGLVYVVQEFNCRGENSNIGLSLYLDKRPKYEKKPSELPPISILIAAYNEEECIYQTLKSIYEQRYPSPFEIILIDDGSTDKTINFVNKVQENQYEINDGQWDATHLATTTVDGNNRAKYRVNSTIFLKIDTNNKVQGKIDVAGQVMKVKEDYV